VLDTWSGRFAGPAIEASERRLSSGSATAITPSQACVSVVTTRVTCVFMLVMAGAMPKEIGYPFGSPIAR
jgi:hypothetical protein